MHRKDTKDNIFQKNFNLCNNTTIKVGGVTEFFAEPINIWELTNLIKWSKFNNQQCQIIGAGSNLLIKYLH